MKTTLALPLLSIFFLLLSCSKNAIDVEDLSRFKTVYIVQAGEGYDKHVLEITDSIQTIAISAALGGDLRLNNDLVVTMEPDIDLVSQFNAVHLTDFLPLPLGSFEIVDNQVTIKKGKAHSSPLVINLKTKDYIEPGVSYLLPISIANADAGIPISGGMKTAYIQIAGTYPLGEEPATKVWELNGRTFKYLFTVQGALAGTEIDPLDVYEYDNSAGVFKNEPVAGLPTGGFGVFDMVIAYPTGLIARDVNGVYSGVPGSIFEYPLNVEARTLTGLGITGNGFNDYNLLTFSARQNAMYGRKANGDLEVIRKVGAMWSDKTVVGSGYDRYTIIEAYQEGLLAMQNNGDLWYINIAADGQFDEPRQVGSGWNKYSKLMANGDKLLAVDAAGTVWQYDFDLRGTWNVGQ